MKLQHIELSQLKVSPVNVRKRGRFLACLAMVT